MSTGWRTAAGATSWLRSSPPTVRPDAACNATPAADTDPWRPDAGGAEMAFIQIIDFRSKDDDQIHALDEEWAQSTEGKRTARRSILTRDRNDPDHYQVIVFFDSYESAMKNSELPETRAISEKMAAISESPVFHDLDVVEDRS